MRSTLKSEYYKDRKITFMMFFFNKRAFFALVSCALIGIFTAFYSAFLSLVVISFGIEASAAGYVFAVPCLFFAISSFLVTYIVEKLPRRLFIFLSFAVTVVSLFLMGPSELLHLPNSFWILLLGLAINGAAQGFVFIPLLPEIIDSVALKQELVEGIDDDLDE